MDRYVGELSTSTTTRGSTQARPESWDLDTAALMRRVFWDAFGTHTHTTIHIRVTEISRVLIHVLHGLTIKSLAKLLVGMLTRPRN